MPDSFYWLAIPVVMLSVLVIGAAFVEHLAPRARRSWTKRLRRIERGRAAMKLHAKDYKAAMDAQARWIEDNCYWHRGD